MNRYAAALLLLGLFFPHIALANKPLPPPQLATFFAEVIEMEDAVGEGEWDTADKTMEEVGEIFENVSPILKAQIGDTAQFAFADEVEVLKKAVTDRDKKRTLAALIAVQGKLFSAMDKYLYMVHPAVLIIDQYTLEAVEAAERGDFERVEHELKEVEVFLAKAAAVLEAKGAGPGMQKDFSVQIEKALAASKRRDHAMASLELGKLKRISGTFVYMMSQ